MDFAYESKKLAEGYSHIIGCDEVGRGSLAGPVVAAAVIINAEVGMQNSEWLSQVKDSKQLTPEKRLELSTLIKQFAWWSIGEVDEKTIDEINIHNATLLAMRRAVDGLPTVIPADASRAGIQEEKIVIAIDGKFTIPKTTPVPKAKDHADNNCYTSNSRHYSEFKQSKLWYGASVKQEAVVGGDNKILSIAAASIIAKVYRDELMTKLHNHYPHYNFAQHKGYGTLHHRQMIKQHGVCNVHRLTFCH